MSYVVDVDRYVDRQDRSQIYFL